MALNLDNIVRHPGRAASEQIVETADKDLFLHLLVPVKKHLYNFIRKSMNFSQEADDIFQDTLLKSFRYFHSFKRDKSFKTWIFTIAHNLLKDHFKTGRGLVLIEDADGLPVDEDPSIPRDVRDIYQAAAGLRPRQREIFYLYYYNEFKVPEIVRITGLTRVNVKFILHQARKAVKEIMEVGQ